MSTCPWCHEGVLLDEPEAGMVYVCPCCCAELVVHFDHERDEYVLTEKT